MDKAEQHKQILLRGNAAIAEGNYEGFLVHCSDDTEWTFLGDRVLKGKAAVRDYMKTAYKEPPQFSVQNLVAEGDYLIAIGEITMKDEEGAATRYQYCDVWRFENAKIVELRAFVVDPQKVSGAAKMSQSS